MLSNSSDSNTYPEWLDFEYFRQQGLLHIGRLSGNIWTDHNTHDPGITILEVLCYALLDLGYRNQFDTGALFARKPADAGKTDEVFFAPAEILSVNPLTLADFKKLLLDIPGVRNAWLEKAAKQEVAIYADTADKKLKLTPNGATTHEVKIKGLYNVYIDLEPFNPAYGAAGKDETGEQIVRAVWKQLQAHRPLCEDFKSVQVIQQESVRFCMDIDLTPDAIPEDVFVEIFEAIQQFLTPVVKFYTLQEMLEKGRTIDQIFEGRPLLMDDQGKPFSHGFTDSEELPALDPKSELHLSDIYNLILNELPGGGVRAIRSLKFFTDANPSGDAWLVSLNPLKSPRLNPLACEIRYSKGQLPIEFDVASVQRKLNRRLANYYKIKRKPYELGFDIPQGTYYDLADYTSIQREFPEVYGVGEGQLPEISERMDEKERQFRELKLRQALQLKAYLAFFDQLLANYLSQLSKLRQLFALRPATPLTSTYFNTPVNSMPDAPRVLRQIEAISGVKESPYTLFHRRPIATILPVPGAEKPAFSDYNGVFATRALRDNMAYFFQKAFADSSIISSIIDRWETEDPNISPCDRFYYLFTLSGGGAVLRSNTFYETQSAAEEALELARYLGFLPRCYAEQDTEAGYGSALVYDPLGYADFLQYITESETTFLSRREQFLDHLLARFAEQFTEYTLLAYAMDGKAKAQPEIVEDKARFLANYPMVSRNRGKGFDYSKTPVWNTDNVSGFEQRVAGFMGLDDWERRTLNHIKLTSDVIVLSTKWLWNDVTLFKTEACTISDSLKTLFENGALLKMNCEAEGTFGFKLRDPKSGCEVQYLPVFASAENRDEAIAFWKNFTASKPVEAWERMDRFRFVLRDAAGNTVLRSTRFYNTKAEATKAFYAAIALALDITHYRDETRVATANEAEGFGFSLIDAAQQVIAEPVYWYDTPELRNSAKTAFVSIIQTCYLPFSVEKTDAALEWRILSATGQVLLIGTHPRRAYDPAGAFETLWQALQHARQDNGWELTLAENGQYYWSLAKIDAQTRLFLPPETPQNRIELARSARRYHTETEAYADWPLLQAQLQAPVSLENALTAVGATAWRFHLIHPDDASTLLISQDLFAGKDEAAIAYEALIAAARDASHYESLPNGRLLVHYNYEKQTGYDDKKEVPIFEYLTGTAISAYPLPEGAAVQMAALINQNAGRLLTLQVPKSQFFHHFYLAGAGANEGHVYDLFGAATYDSEAAAWDALPVLFSLFQKTGVAVEKSPDSDHYRLVLHKPNGAEAAYGLEEYPKAPVLRTFDQLKPWPDLSGDTFGYRIGFLDCACELHYFYSSNDVVFNTADEAVAAGTAVFNQVKKCTDQPVAGAYAIVAQGNLLQIVDCDTETVQASAPNSWQKEDDACNAITSFWAFNLFGSGEMGSQPVGIDFQPAENFRFLPGFNPQSTQTDAFLSRFRLRDDTYAIACYYRTFATPNEREAAAFAFRQYWQKADRQFPVVSGAMSFQSTAQTLVAGGDQCAPPRRIYPWCYRFSLICGEKTYLFDSVWPYESEEDAHAQLDDAALVAQINLLADPAAYLIVDINGDCKTFCIQVFDYKNVALKPKLMLSTVFSTEMEARIAQKNLLRCATAYPLYLDTQHHIRFRLVQWLEADPKSDALQYLYPWSSILSYPSAQEARCAFLEFLRLLEYPANVRLTEKPWGLDVGEIMLESVAYDAPTASEYPNCPPAIRRELNIWEKGVEGQLFSRVFHPEGVVIVPETNCQVQATTSPDYAEMLFPLYYPDEATRQHVINTIQKNYKDKKYPAFDLITLTDQSLQSSKSLSGSNEAQAGYFSFFIKSKNEETEVDVVWKISPESPQASIEKEGWYLFGAAAEQENFYSISTVSKGKFKVQLRAASNLLADAYVTGSNIFSRDIADKVVHTTIQRALEHPVKKNERNNMYSIRIQWPTSWHTHTETARGLKLIDNQTNTLWEVNKTFETTVEAEAYVTAYLTTLLSNNVFAESSAYFLTENPQPESAEIYGFKTYNTLPAAQVSGTCCGYSYQVVSDGYCIASHPYRYRNAAERTRHKQAIQRAYRCGEKPLSSFIIPKIKQTPPFPKECNGQIVEVSLEDYYCFNLVNVNAQESAVQWRISVPDIKIEGPADVWYWLTPWIEYREFYQKTVLPDGNTTLSLCDEDGKIIANAWISGKSMFDGAVADQAIIDTILQAREYPIKRKRTTRKDGKDEYLIQIYSRYWSPAPNTDGIPGAYIWIGKYQFETQPEAHAFFEPCFLVPLNKWAANKEKGYLDTQEPDCGDYSFNLVNPDRIIARYPARFGARHEAEQSVEKMKALLNAEGFHFLENILLRPLFQPDSDAALIGLLKETTNAWDTYLQATIGGQPNLFQSCFKKHLPGSDPYSAYATVLLPYWAPRFQNARFREFFENTLRRELPAHCRLRVVWVTPRDMFNFEIKYQHWLTALASGEPDEGKAELVQVSSSITSFYRLILDDPKSFLDEVTLS